MPAKRELTMRQIRQLLRLAHDGVSAREMGRRLGVARSTIQDNLNRAAAAGIVWPLPDDVSDDIAAILDPFGNATHTALSFDLVGEDVLITGAGPIGVMACAIAKHLSLIHI